MSICIPTYNGARYLRECLDSALSQTFEDFEILVVDDGSLDETASIVKDYASNNDRIRVHLGSRRRGLVGNWNRCVELARGSLIKFLFQDDLIDPSCLERMISAYRSVAAQGISARLIACRRRIVFENVPEHTRRTYAKYLEAESLGGVFGTNSQIRPLEFCEAVLAHLMHNFIGEPTSMLVHKSVFKTFGTFCPDLVSMCDLEYWIRVGIHEGLICLPDTLATFRVHEGGTSAINAVERQYRLRTLDPAILMYRFAFGRLYGPLRAVASEHRPPLDLKRQFAVAAVRARTRAVRAAREGNSFPMEEWRAAVTKYPKLIKSREVRVQSLRHVVARGMRRLVTNS